jgi:hypothetical protein
VHLYLCMSALHHEQTVFRTLLITVGEGTWENGGRGRGGPGRRRAERRPASRKRNAQDQVQESG